MSVFIPKAHKPNQTTIVWDTNFNYPKVVDEVVVIHEKSETYPHGVYSVKKSVVDNFVNIDESINSYADDVGVYNILNKVEMTGDISLLHVSSGEDIINDASNLPVNEHEAVRAAQKVLKLLKMLPLSLLKVVP